VAISFKGIVPRALPLTDSVWWLAEERRADAEEDERVEDEAGIEGDSVEVLY